MIALLFLEIVALLGVMAVLAVFAYGGTPRRWDGHRTRLSTFLDAEKDLAASLGWTPRSWAMIRVGCITGALLLGLLSGVVVVTVVLVLLALVGMPWLLEDVAAGRRSRTDRAFVTLLRDVANGLTRTGNLDIVLREVALHPAPELRRVLAPLRVADIVPVALLEVAAASRSPFIEDVTVLLLAGRTHNPGELARQLREQVIPAIEEQILLHDAYRAAAATQRRGAQVIGAVLGLLVGVFGTVPALHDFLASTQGQATLVVDALLCVASIMLMGALLRPQRPVRWDLGAVPAALERIAHE